MTCLDLFEMEKGGSYLIAWKVLVLANKRLSGSWVIDTRRCFGSSFEI
jgi:hypothetical protein